MLQCRNYVLESATIKQNNVLSIGESIFFLLRVAYTRIETNIKGHYIEKPPKSNYANTQVF